MGIIPSALQDIFQQIQVCVCVCACMCVYLQSHLYNYLSVLCMHTTMSNNKSAYSYPFYALLVIIEGSFVLIFIRCSNESENNNYICIYTCIVLAKRFNFRRENPRSLVQPYSGRWVCLTSRSTRRSYETCWTAGSAPSTSLSGITNRGTQVGGYCLSSLLSHPPPHSPTHPTHPLPPLSCGGLQGGEGGVSRGGTQSSVCWQHVQSHGGH